MKNIKSNKILKEKWEDSFKRYENYIFYPNGETVKFLNRFVRKQTGIYTYIDILDFSTTIKGLDFGCGIGRQTILMNEFGVEAYGIDISQQAIKMSKKLTKSYNLKDIGIKFKVFDGINIPFENNFFDITIADAVLDSVNFNLGKILIKEIDRVTTNLLFMSLISGDNDRHGVGEIIRTVHERGTIQSYYNWKKILRLISVTNFKLKWCSLISEKSLLSRGKNSRYYIVLEKK